LEQHLFGSTWTRDPVKRILTQKRRREQRYLFVIVGSYLALSLLVAAMVCIVIGHWSDVLSPTNGFSTQTLSNPSVGPKG